MLDTTSTKDRLELIANTEGVKFEDGVLDTLIKTSDGDLRRAITYLQSAARLHNTSNSQRSAITPASIVEIAGVIPPEVIVEIGKAAGLEPPPDAEGDRVMEEAMGDAVKGSFEACHRVTKKVAMEGYSASQLLIQLHDYIIEHPTLPAKNKAKCALAFGEADKALVDGADEELQLLNLTLKLLRSLQ